MLSRWPLLTFGEWLRGFCSILSRLTLIYRFGEGVTREVGMDFANQKARKVGVFTDGTVGKLLPMQMAIESLEANNISYEIYDKTRVEPNQES